MSTLWFARSSVQPPGKNTWRGLLLNSDGYSELCPHAHRTTEAAFRCADDAANEQNRKVTEGER